MDFPQAGYQLLADASGLESEYGYIRVQFQIQQFRLLNWARIARVTEGGQGFFLGSANRGLVLDILEQQSILLFQFGRYDARAAPLATPIIVEERSHSNKSVKTPTQDGTSSRADLVRFPQSEELLKTALSYIEKTRNFPKRLRWAALDKKKMDTLLGKLSNLNDILENTLSSDKMEQLAETSVGYQIDPSLCYMNVSNIGLIGTNLFSDHPAKLYCSTASGYRSNRKTSSPSTGR
jgi:hypothetical protein